MKRFKDKCSGDITSKVPASDDVLCDLRQALQLCINTLEAISSSDIVEGY